MPHRRAGAQPVPHAADDEGVHEDSQGHQRLCWVEGPTALGFEDWWATGERHEIAVIRRQLDRAAEVGALLVTDLDMLAHVLFGAVAGGVLAMARSEDPET